VAAKKNQAGFTARIDARQRGAANFNADYFLRGYNESGISANREANGAWFLAWSLARKSDQPIATAPASIRSRGVVHRVFRDAA
jgi:hypothetical protein